MSDTNNTFKKAPKRKPTKGKSVSGSPEMRQAYADLIQERAEKQEAYGSSPAAGRDAAAVGQAVACHPRQIRLAARGFQRACSPLVGCQG